MTPWKTARQQWLQRRFPPSREITLGLRQVFVIPTATSAALLVAVLILFLMAVNFQSALIYGLSFWLLALLVVAIFFTYRNLSGLTLTALRSSPCFAGEKAVFELRVEDIAGRSKQAIFIGWSDEDLVEIDLPADTSTLIKLSAPTRQRGYFHPGRLQIVSRYPLGLIVAFSYAQLDMKSIVYPVARLQPVNEQATLVHSSSEGGAEVPRGTTDFDGVRNYQAGDSPRHIHWKNYARTGNITTKSFVDFSVHERWLDWDTLNFAGIENKLSHLAARVLQCHQEQQEYGLKLPGTTLQPDQGEAHMHRCLTTLALYAPETSEHA